MFVNIDSDSFPLVKVVFGKTPKSYEDLDIFFETWLQLYQNKQEFTFLLDTRNCGNIPIKYIYYISKQISKIKKLKTQYLQRTIVIMQSNWIKNLMKILFKIVKPVAPVYIVKKQDTSEQLYFRIKNNLLKSDLDYDVIDSKKPAKVSNNSPCCDTHSQ